MSRSSLLLTALLCAFFTSTAIGDSPTLTLPSTVTGGTGEFITVPATTGGKTVVWYSIDPGLHLFPVQLLKDTRTAVVTSGQAGSYRLLAVTAQGDELSTPFVCTVVIKSPAVKTPTPTPTPTPAPPANAGVSLFEWPTTCGPNGCPVAIPSTVPLRGFRR